MSRVTRPWLRRVLIAYGAVLAVAVAFRYGRDTHRRSDPLEQGVAVDVVRATQAGGGAVEIVYREYRPPDSPRGTIVMLHGSPGHKEDFRRVGPLVAERFGYRVIAPDLPGFGDSTIDLPDYSFLAHAVYVRELMDRLGIPRAHVVAYSMAGGVALHLADLWPERVQSITMLSAIGVQEMELLGEYHVNHSVHAFQLAALWTMRAVTLGLGPVGPGAIAYARNFYDSDQRPLRGILGRVTMPMLVIHGTSDILVPYEAAVEHHRLVPQSELLSVAHDNHFMPFVRAGFLADHIGDFVARVDRGEAVTRPTADPARAREAALPFDPSHLPKARGITAVVWTGLLAAATFVSEDLTGVAAGVLAAQGRLSFALAVLGCFIGIVVGDLLLFVAGRYIGRPVVDLPPIKWLITPEAIERSSAWLERRGAAVVLFSRFVPGMRLPTYVAAGVLRTSVWKFLGWFIAAAALWTPLLVGVSALGGAALLKASRASRLPTAVGLAAVIALVAIGVQLVVLAATWRGRRLLLSRWRRLTRWEFWPPWVFYLPVFAYLVFLMAKHRSATVFTAANPSMPAGGFVGESKHDILTRLEGASQWVARSTLIRGEAEADEKRALARQFMSRHNLTFPVVIKPDQGQRGSGVVVVRTAREMDERLNESAIDTIVQEYVDGAEFGVFYYRRASEPRGRIFSITDKRLISVTGDGRRTLEALILSDDRAVCMARAHLERHRDRLSQVPASGERFRLVDLGTHCRGAMFLDGSWILTDALEARFDEISRTFEGFHFGRFDVRTWDVDEFRRGGAFRIIELNGVTSEATHIYDPRNSIWSAYRTLMAQWRIAFEIGEENRRHGVATTPVRSLVRLLIDYRRTARRHLSATPRPAAQTSSLNGGRRPERAGAA